jgi:hypothetical protein
MPKLISSNQGGFMQNRQIVDNIVCVQEAIHSSVTSKNKGMVINIYMENSFDCVCHSFFSWLMEKLSFNTSFITMVDACIWKPWIDPLVNGCPTSFFQISRGLHQGYPLSPLIFLIIVVTLSRKLEFERISGNSIGLQIARGVKNINHSQFVDDALLLGGASSIIASYLRICSTPLLMQQEEKSTIINVKLLDGIILLEQ